MYLKHEIEKGHIYVDNKTTDNDYRLIFNVLNQTQLDS